LKGCIWFFELNCGLVILVIFLIAPQNYHQLKSANLPLEDSKARDGD